MVTSINKKADSFLLFCIQQIRLLYIKCYIWQNKETNITYCCSFLLSQPQKNENSDTFSTLWWQAWFFPGRSKSKNILKYIKSIREVLCGNIMWIQTCTLYSMLYIQYRHIMCSCIYQELWPWTSLMKWKLAGSFYELYILHVNYVFYSII